MTFPLDNKSWPAVSLHHDRSLMGEVFHSYTFVLWTDKICACPPLLLCTDQNLLSRWALCSSAITVAWDDGGVLYVWDFVCEWVRACTKGLAALTCRKDVKSVITLADNKWFSCVWMCVSELLLYFTMSVSKRKKFRVYICVCALSR